MGDTSLLGNDSSVITSAVATGAATAAAVENAIGAIGGSSNSLGSLGGSSNAIGALGGSSNSLGSHGGSSNAIGSHGGSLGGSHGGSSASGNSSKREKSSNTQNSQAQVSHGIQGNSQVQTLHSVQGHLFGGASNGLSNGNFVTCGDFLAPLPPPPYPPHTSGLYNFDTSFASAPLPGIRGTLDGKIFTFGKNCQIFYILRKNFFLKIKIFQKNQRFLFNVKHFFR